MKQRPKEKWMLHVLLPALAGLFLIAGLAYRISARNTEQSYRLSYESVLNNSSRVLDMNLDNVVEVVRTFMNSEALQEIAKTSTYEGSSFHSYDQLSMEKVFKSLSQQNAWVNNIVFMDLHGHHYQFSNVNRGTYEFQNYYETHDFLEEAWSQRAREADGKEIFMGENVLGVENGDVFCLCKYMINPSTNEPMGYLVVSLSRSLLRHSYIRTDSGYETNCFMILNEDGDSIFFDGEESMRENLMQNFSGEKGSYVLASVKNRETGWTLLHAVSRQELFRTSLVVLLLVFAGGGVLIAVFLWILQLSYKNNELSRHLMEVQLNEREAEILLLQSQINPHFLYNTLDSLYFLAIVHGDDQIADMTMALSNNFKLALNRGSKYIEVSDAIQWMEDYLKIQNMRYNDRFKLTIDVEEELLNRKILSFILQPFVENAMYHGLEAKIGKGSISLTGKRDGRNMVFVIEDDGIGIEDLTVLEKGYGIRNVRERIRLHYGDAYGVQVESRRNEGTKVTVTVPMEDGENVSTGSN